MKTRRLVIIVILFLLGNSLIAQKIEIKEVDDSEFPLINVAIEFPKDASIDFKGLKVF